MRSRDERPDGSLPAFAWGDVAEWRNLYLLHYKGAFASSVFLYPQPYRRPLRFTFPFGRATDLPCSACVPRWLRLCLFAGDACVSDGGNWIPPYPSRTFWFKPVSTFGLFVFTAFMSSSHMLTIPSNSSALTALVLAVITFLHSSATLSREATLSRKLPNPWIIPSAGFGRVLVGEHQVESCYPVSTATHATSCRNQFHTKRAVPAALAK